MSTCETEFVLAPGEGVIVETPEGAFSITLLEFDEPDETVWLEIDGECVKKIRLDDANEREYWGTPECFGLTRLWLLWSIAIPRDVRVSVFLPAFNELLEDYLEAKSAFRGAWERRWIGAVFTARSLRMMLQCIGIRSPQRRNRMLTMVKWCLALPLFGHLWAHLIKRWTDG